MIKTINKNENKIREPIAIIGISCRLPGGVESPEDYWRLLVNKVDAISDIPSDRWDKDALYDPDVNKRRRMSVMQGGFIDNIADFDAQFFGISPVEALRIDPQHRILLENVYRAMEDAGIPQADFAGSNCGVFIGISSHDYADITNAYGEQINIGPNTMTGISNSIAANRISYVFDLKGPSFAVDTACSSSLIAVHQALTSIWSGESDTAFVGGVNAILKPESTMAFSKGGFLSPDCRCKPFDSRANGYIRSEGCGVILLKPYSQALKDGDDIYALIRGSAINQDGHTAGIAMPSKDAQILMLETAYGNAGVPADKVHYIEAHGTGTAAGDPIEGEAIGTVIGGNREDSDDTCFIGSVKSNIGHLEPASGMAGLIKLALSLKKRQVPPNIHFETPNPDIDFNKFHLRVPTDVEALPEAGDLYGGVNSFGFGGSNAHVVLQSPAVPVQPTIHQTDSDSSDSPYLYLLSARSKNALVEMAKQHCEFLESTTENLHSICYSLAQKRSHFENRLAVAGDSKEALIKKLEAFIAGEELKGIETRRIGLENTDAKTAFVFSGQGPQWWAMGRELLETNAGYKQTIEKIDAILAGLGWLKDANSSLIKELMKDEDTSRINETEIAQPAIFALQVALAGLWKAKGVMPDAVVGHSIGEMAAAYISGALSLEEATRVVYWRSKCQAAASGCGKMLAVALSEAKAERVLEEYEGTIDIAAVNGPEMVTLAGPDNALTKLARNLEERDIFCRMLLIDIPFHSYLLDFIKDDFLNSTGTVTTASPGIPMYSTVTGALLGDSPADAAYWYRNIRQTVKFYPAIKAMINAGYNTFVEIGPHPILSKNIEKALAESNVKGITTPSLRRYEKEELGMTESLGRLFTWGYSIDWQTIYHNRNTFVKTPAYPWQRIRYWLETAKSQGERIGQRLHPHVKSMKRGVVESGTVLWDIDLEKQTDTYIVDHRVQGPLVYPGAGHCELAIACARLSFGESFGHLEDINFKSALFLPDEGEQPQIQLEIWSDSGNYTISTKIGGEDANWITHSNGRVNYMQDSFKTEALDLADIKARVTDPVDLDLLFADLSAGGLDLGPSFRGIKELWSTEDEAIGRIGIHESIQHGIEQFNIHPALLDASFQTSFGMCRRENDQSSGVYIPVHIDKIKFYRKPAGKTLWSYGRKIRKTDQILSSDMWVFDEEENLILEIQGFVAQYLEGSRKEISKEIDGWFYEYQWTMRARREDELNRRPADYIDSPLNIKRSMQSVIDTIRSRPTERMYHDVFEPVLDQLTIAYVSEAFMRMNIAARETSGITLEALMTKYSIAERHRLLVQRMLQFMEKAGTARRSGDTWRFTDQALDKTSSELMDDALRSYPDFNTELELLGRCGPFLPEVLTGEVDPVTLLFPDNQWDRTVAYYQQSHNFKKYNELAEAALEKMLASLPEDQTLRILEIGAGTGGFSEGLFTKVPADRTEYFFTDLSPTFFMEARKRFKDFPFIQYRVLDIEKDPVLQGYDPGSFDIVIASDVIHATRDISVSLGNIQKLLAPEGLLMMLEVTKGPMYIDLIFGLTEGWWLFEDTQLRAENAIMDRKTWVDVLSKHAYHDIYDLSDITNDHETAQTIFLARNGHAVTTANPDTTGTESDAPGTYLIFADTKGIGQKVANKLAGADNTVIIVEQGELFTGKSTGHYTLNPDDASGYVKLFACIKEENKSVTGILHFWSADITDTGSLTSDSLEHDQVLGSVSGAGIVKALSQAGFDIFPQLWFYTTGAESVADTTDFSIGQAPIWGLSRVIINEHPDIKTVTVDLSHSPDDAEIDNLIKELSAESSVSRDEEIAFRGKKRYIHRFERVRYAKAQQESQKYVKAAGGAYKLTSTKFGVFDNLIFREIDVREPAAGEVKIEVHASALNFRDIMMSLGLLSDEAVIGGLSGKNFGLECAGIVVSAGSGVTGFKPGDAVVAMASGCLAGTTIAPVDLVAIKPDHLSFEEAVTIPITYLTAHYALNYQCRMEKGDKVLIHAGTGGVGIAAIRLAQLAGAEIFTTAGSEEKRQYLRDMGIKHVFDSRSLRFKDDVLNATNGAGVDIVLNSLSGGAISRGIQCLAPYGRFVEIGKTDIYNDKQIGLKPFGNNLSYFAVDVDRLQRQKPAFTGKLYREVIALFEAKKLVPHPTEVFSASRVINAFRFLSQAKHIGKVVISMNEDALAISPKAEITFKNDMSYLIIGGTGGFGLAVGEWMAAKGAGTLVLMSRSGIRDDAAKQKVEALRAGGTRVEVVTGDVTSGADVRRVVNEIKANLPPLKGVVNSSMVLSDSLLVSLTPQDFSKVMNPKVRGTWNLHQATLDCDLDHFILFSSISSLYGTPAQANYAAANAFLNKFSYHRRNLGLPCNTVCWGVLGETGFVSRQSKVHNILSAQGWGTFSLKESFASLERTLVQNSIIRCCAKINWEKTKDAFPHSHNSTRFVHLFAEHDYAHMAGSSGSSDITGTLQAIEDDTERLRMLESHLVDALSKVLGLAIDDIDKEAPLTRLGIDSLMANQLKSWIYNNTGIDFSLMRIMQGPTVPELAVQLMPEMLGSGPGESGSDAEIGESGTSAVDKWIIRINPQPDARFRLFCFSYFGAGASIYNSWQDIINDDIEVCLVQLPGREERMDEPAISDAAELAETLSRIIMSMDDKPFAFYGHSHGGRIAYNLCEHLISEHNIRPAHLFVGGTPAPNSRNQLITMFEGVTVDEQGMLPEALLIKLLNDLRVPDVLLGNEQYMRRMLPTFNADVLLMKTQDQRRNDSIDVPITVFSGTHDTVYNTETCLKEWKDYAHGDYELIEVDGSHFFMNEDTGRRVVIGRIEAVLLKVAVTV